MSITATAIHPPAMIAAIRAFVPAIIALIAAMVALTATFTAWAVAFAVAFAACAARCAALARCAVLAEAFVVGKNALSLCGGFYRTDGVGYLGIEYLDFLSVDTPYRGGDFLGDVRAGHYHRHKNAVNPQRWIDLPSDFRHGAKQQL